MIGRDLKDVFPKRDAQLGEVVLEVKNLKRARLVHDVSFNVRRGEIVGFAGITGSGRTEVVRAIFGADPHTAEMRVEGRTYIARSPTDAIARGIGLVNEDRKAHGLFLKQDVTRNTTLTTLRKVCRGGVIQRAREKAAVQRMIADLRIKTPSAEFQVVNMSGGNQQKVILARWLLSDTKVLIMDEPTRGIDVGAKSEIYQIMNELTKRGVAIIMISSELPEVLGMSDRVLVMREGTIVGELPRAQASEEAIMKHAVGT
ncbi:MAG: ATP-binding cassette domain-containing protein [Anaeromyxobacter sp.]